MNSEAHPKQRPVLPLAAILGFGLLSVVLAAATAMIVVSSKIPTQSDTLSDRDFRDIIIRLERLEEHRAREFEESETAPVAQAGPDMAVAVDDLRIVRERLARLEKMQEGRQSVDRQQAEFAEQARRMTEVYEHKDAIRVMSDPSSNDDMKATAWRSIRFYADQAWTDEIVLEAIRIGTTATDPWLRADIWRQAHANHTSPLLIQPLLQALSSDPDPNVRSEAAETLDLYLEETGVREALQSAGDYDAHPDVRRQAQSSLKGPDSGF